MPLSDNLNNSIAFTRLVFKDLGRYILLVIIDLIPIVNLIILGYGGKIIRETPDSGEPPPLREFVSLWMSGLKIFSVIFIYALVPIIFLVISAAYFMAPFFAIRELGPAPRLPGGLVATSLGIGLILTFAAALIFAIAVTHMVKTDRFSSAFDLRQILAIIGRIGWDKYVLWIIVMFILFLVASAMSRIPILGFLVSAAVLPLLTIFASRSIGLLYSAASPRLPTPPQALDRFCIQCGSPLPSNASFCPSCGYKRSE